MKLAALAAKNLPRLRIKELWNLDKKTGYLLRHTQNCYRSILTWICVGRALPLSSMVVEQWATVAPAGYHFDVVEDVLTEDNDQDGGEDNDEDNGEDDGGTDTDGEDEGEDEGEDDSEGDGEEEGEEESEYEKGNGRDGGARSVRDEKFVFRKLILQGLAYDPLTLAQVEARIERMRAERWNT